jgi:hypothetical protein
MTWEGIEPSDKCRPILLHCIGQHGLGLPFHGVRSPRDGQSASVLTARVAGGLDLLQRMPPLLGRVYPMSE